MLVELIRDPAVLAGLRPAWLRLAGGCAAATPYSHPDFVTAWFAQRVEPAWRCLVARDRAGALAGVLPLVRYQDGTVRYAGHDVHDEAAALGGPEARTALWRAAVRGLAADGDCARLDLPTVATADAAELALLGGATRLAGVDPGARIDLSGGWDRYSSGLSATRRRRLRALRRGLERDHGPVTVTFTGPAATGPAAAGPAVTGPAVTGPSELRAAVGRLCALRDESWRARGRFAELAGHLRGPALHDFVLAVATGRDRPATVAELTTGDRPAAAALLLAAGRRWWYPICGYDAELARYGPGLVLLLECVRAATAGGVQAVELGRGVEPYKFTLGARRYELPDLVVEPVRPAAG